MMADRNRLAHAELLAPLLDNPHGIVNSPIEVVDEHPLQRAGVMQNDARIPVIEENLLGVRGGGVLDVRGEAVL